MYDTTFSYHWLLNDLFFQFSPFVLIAFTSFCKGLLPDTVYEHIIKT
jgi:hypothetical protein